MERRDRRIPQYNPDTGYGPTSQQVRRQALTAQRQLREIVFQTQPPKVTEYAIRMALRSAAVSAEQGKPVGSVTVNGVSHTVEEWNNIRTKLLGKKISIWE